MMRFSLLILVTLTFNSILLGDTVSVTVNPAFQSVSAGQPVTVDVGVSGLENPPSVGAFDLSVGFDSALLVPTGVAFGRLLGDPAVPTALTDFMLSPGVVEFAEVSLLPSEDLDTLQTSSFALAQLSFMALSSGTASLFLSAGVVDDTFGNKLAVVPEPRLLLPLSFVVLLTIGLSKRKPSSPVAGLQSSRETEWRSAFK